MRKAVDDNCCMEPGTAAGVFPKQSRRGTFMADTITLTDHDAIRSWAAGRAGFPAIVDISPEAGTQPMLRLVFGQHAYQDQDQPERPVNAGGYELVEWDEWFK